MYIINTKNKKYAGVLSGIQFFKGEATVKELSSFDKVWLEDKGCTVEKIKSKSKKENEDEDKEEAVEEVKEEKEPKKKGK